MSNCILYDNLNTEEKAIHDHIGQYSKAALYDIWNSLNQSLPKSLEEANAYIEQYKSKKNLQENLELQPTVAEILDDLAQKSQEVVKEGEIFRRTSDNKRVNRVTDLLETHKQRSGYYSKGGNNLPAKKGTVLHSYLQHIVNNFSSGKDAHLFQIRQQIIDELKQHPDFKNEPNSFFDLSPQQFKHLGEGVQKLLNSFEAIQKRIDPKGSYTIRTEQLVFDKGRNVVGTIDLLVLFSDGSAAVYDYKTKSFGKSKTISTVKKTDWMFQMSNYTNMLRDVYGILNIRQARILPIEVDFNDPKDYTKQVTEGFQLVSMLNEDYLKPIAVRERTSYRAMDSYITSLENKRNELVYTRKLSNLETEKVKISRQIKAIDNTLQAIYLDKDASATLSKIIQIAKYYEEKIHLTQYDQGGFDLSDLVEVFQELDSYDGIIVAFSEEIRAAFKSDKERHAKLSEDVKRAQEIISNLKDNVEQKIYSQIGNKHIYLGGQRLSTAIKYFGGIDSINTVAMKEANLFLVQYMEEARMKTERQVSDLQDLYKKVISWGLSNNYTETSVMELFYDENIDFTMEYTPEFYKKFQELTRKYRQKKELTQEEKNWLIENYEVDVAAWKNFRQKAVKGLKEQAEKRLLVPDGDRAANIQAMKDKLEEMDTFTDPTKLENFFKGNTKREQAFLIPKKNRRQHFSEKYQIIEKNKPLLDYYNKWREFMDSYIADFGRDRIGKNFIPNVLNDLAGTIKDGSIVNLGKFGRLHLNKLAYREGDSFMGAVDTATNKKIKVIPLSYVDQFNIQMNETLISRIEQEAEVEVGRDSEQFDEVVRQKKSEWYNEQRRALKSKNIHRSMIMFITAANEYSARHTIKDYWDGIKILISSDNYQRFQEKKDEKAAYDKNVGEIAKIMGADPKLIEVFNHYYDRLIYGQRFEKDFKIFDKYSVNKIAQTMSTFVSATFVGAHPILAASNYITARNNFKMFSKEGRWWSEKGADKAMKWWGKKDENMVKVYQYFKPTNRNILQELADESTGFTSKWIRLKTLFWAHIKGDERIDAVIAASMASTWVLDSDGVIKNPLTTEIINKDAKPVAELIQEKDDGSMSIEGLSMREHARFQSKMRKIANEVKGMADERQKGLIHASLTGSQLMLLRSWMPGMARARLKTLQFDLTLEELDHGRYLIAFEEIVRGGLLPTLHNFTKLLFQTITFQKYKANSTETEYRDFINNKIQRFLESITREERQMIEETYGDKFGVDQFIKLHEGKMNAMVYELRIYLSWFFALMAVRMMEFDDREEDNIFTVFKYNSHEIVRRALLELTFWTSPQSAMQIIRSPFAMTGAIKNLRQVIEEWVLEVSFLLRGKRDPDKRTYPGYYTLKNLPVVNRIDNLYNLFEPYNRPKTLSEKIFWDVFKDED